VKPVKAHFCRWLGCPCKRTYACDGVKPAVGVPAPGVPGVAGAAARVGDAAVVGLPVVGLATVGVPVVGLAERVAVGEAAAAGAAEAALAGAADELATGARVAVGEDPHAARRPRARINPPNERLNRLRCIESNSFVNR
jgi:hypothetical protein